MAKKTDLGPNLVPKIFFMGFTSTRSSTLWHVITACNFKENLRIKLEKMAKN